jgi:hypothetical protein
MRVDIHLYSQSNPVSHTGVRNAYTKDGLYCVMLADGSVYKYPVVHIFRVRETPPPAPSI